MSSPASKSVRSLTGARDYCANLIKNHDRSWHVIQRYIPGAASDAVLGIKAFNLETARIADTVSKPEIAKMRFDFWRSSLQKTLSGPGPGPGPTAESSDYEPISVLLSNSRQFVKLSKRYFITLIQTREHYLLNKPFRSLDTICQYGEGTFSQVGYLLQEALEPLVPESELEVLDQGLLDEIIAHIGQASAVASFLKSYPYYFRYHGLVSLPVSVMAKHDLSQEALLKNDYDPSKLADVAFETATRANDHLLTARMKLSALKELLPSSRTLSDATFVPLMSALPTQLYLEKLEKAQFNLLSSSLQREWKLPWKSYRSYRLRQF